MAIFTISAFGFIPEDDVDVGDKVVKVDQQDQPVVMVPVASTTQSHISQAVGIPANEQAMFEQENMVSFADLDDDVGWQREARTQEQPKQTSTTIGSSGGVPYNCS